MNSRVSDAPAPPGYQLDVGVKATLEAIAAGHPASDIDQLLPWAFTPTSR